MTPGTSSHRPAWSILHCPEVSQTGKDDTRMQHSGVKPCAPVPALTHQDRLLGSNTDICRSKDVR